MPSSLRDRLDWLRPVLKSRRFWASLLGLAAGFVGFVLLLNYAVMPLWTRHDANVQVPEVRQLPEDEAADVLRRAGLRPERREQPFNPNLPADIVVDQTPLPSSNVKPGRRIYYYVNASPREMVTVPDVAGPSVSEGVARSELQEAGLIVGDVRMDTLRTPFEGTVTRQTPPGGSVVPRGTRITLWLSPGVGRDEVTVPDVTGLTPAQARQVLLEAGLWVGNVQGDTVRWQEPRPGNRLREGTEVRLHTSEPPEGWNRPPEPPREPEPDEEPGTPTEDEEAPNAQEPEVAPPPAEAPPPPPPQDQEEDRDESADDEDG